MTSVCISNCVNDARDPRVPVRATYVNLYKWPESDAEFVRSVTSSKNVRRGVHNNGNVNVVHGHPRVVDSISCRQMYLRSYKFSRDEDAENEKTAMCFGRLKEKDNSNSNNNNGRRNSKRKEIKGRRKRKCLRKFSCSALFRIFHRLLSCGASVDVVDR